MTPPPLRSNTLSQKKTTPAAARSSEDAGQSSNTIASTSAPASRLAFSQFPLDIGAAPTRKATPLGPWARVRKARAAQRSTPGSGSGSVSSIGSGPVLGLGIALGSANEAGGGPNGVYERGRLQSISSTPGAGSMPASNGTVKGKAKATEPSESGSARMGALGRVVAWGSRKRSQSTSRPSPASTVVAADPNRLGDARSASPRLDASQVGLPLPPFPEPEHWAVSSGKNSDHGAEQTRHRQPPAGFAFPSRAQGGSSVAPPSESRASTPSSSSARPATLPSHAHSQSFSPPAPKTPLTSSAKHSATSSFSASGLRRKASVRKDSTGATGERPRIRTSSLSLSRFGAFFAHATSPPTSAPVEVAARPSEEAWLRGNTETVRIAASDPAGPARSRPATAGSVPTTPSALSTHTSPTRKLSRKLSLRGRGKAKGGQEKDGVPVISPPVLLASPRKGRTRKSLDSAMNPGEVVVIAAPSTGSGSELIRTRTDSPAKRRSTLGTNTRAHSSQPLLQLLDDGTRSTSTETSRQASDPSKGALKPPINMERLRFIPTPDISSSPISARAIMREAEGRRSSLRSAESDMGESGQVGQGGGQQATHAMRDAHETHVLRGTEGAGSSGSDGSQQAFVDAEATPRMGARASADIEAELLRAEQSTPQGGDFVQGLGLWTDDRESPAPVPHGMGSWGPSYGPAFVTEMTALSSGRSSSASDARSYSTASPVRDLRRYVQDAETRTTAASLGATRVSPQEELADPVELESGSDMTDERRQQYAVGDESIGAQSSSSSSTRQGRPYSLISTGEGDTPIVRLRTLAVDTTEDGPDDEGAHSDLFFSRSRSSEGRSDASFAAFAPTIEGAMSTSGRSVDEMSTYTRAPTVPSLPPSPDPSPSHSHSASPSTTTARSPRALPNAQTVAASEESSVHSHSASVHSSGSSTLNANRILAMLERRDRDREREREREREPGQGRGHGHGQEHEREREERNEADELSPLPTTSPRASTSFRGHKRTATGGSVSTVTSINGNGLTGAGGAGTGPGDRASVSSSNLSAGRTSMLTLSEDALSALEAEVGRARRLDVGQVSGRVRVVEWGKRLAEDGAMLQLEEGEGYEAGEELEEEREREREREPEPEHRGVDLVQEEEPELAREEASASTIRNEELARGGDITASVSVSDELPDRDRALEQTHRSATTLGSKRSHGSGSVSLDYRSSETGHTSSPTQSHALLSSRHSQGYGNQPGLVLVPSLADKVQKREHQHEQEQERESMVEKSVDVVPSPSAGGSAPVSALIDPVRASRGARKVGSKNKLRRSRSQPMSEQQHQRNRKPRTLDVLPDQPAGGPGAASAPKTTTEERATRAVRNSPTVGSHRIRSRSRTRSQSKLRKSARSGTGRSASTATTSTNENTTTSSSRPLKESTSGNLREEAGREMGGDQARLGGRSRAQKVREEEPVVEAGARNDPTVSAPPETPKSVANEPGIGGTPVSPSPSKFKFATSEEAAQAKRREQEDRERRAKEREQRAELKRLVRYAQKKRSDPLLAARLALVGLTPDAESEAALPRLRRGSEDTQSGREGTGGERRSKMRIEVSGSEAGAKRKERDLPPELDIAPLYSVSPSSNPHKHESSPRVAKPPAGKAQREDSNTIATPASASASAAASTPTPSKAMLDPGSANIDFFASRAPSSPHSAPYGSASRASSVFAQSMASFHTAVDDGTTPGSETRDQAEVEGGQALVRQDSAQQQQQQQRLSVADEQDQDPPRASTSASMVTSTSVASDMAQTLSAISFPLPPSRARAPQRSDDGTILARAGLREPEYDTSPEQDGDGANSAAAGGISAPVSASPTIHQTRSDTTVHLLGVPSSSSPKIRRPHGHVHAHAQSNMQTALRRAKSADYRSLSSPSPVPVPSASAAPPSPSPLPLPSHSHSHSHSYSRTPRPASVPDSPSPAVVNGDGGMMQQQHQQQHQQNSDGTRTPTRRLASLPPPLEIRLSPQARKPQVSRVSAELVSPVRSHRASFADESMVG